MKVMIRKLIENVWQLEWNEIDNFYLHFVEPEVLHKSI